MQTNTLLRKGLAVGIILLFICVAIAPSINFHVVKASDDNDLVEVTSQACGIQGTQGGQLPSIPSLGLSANSYHAFYENNTWTVITCNFTKPTNVNLTILQRFSYNDTSDTTRFIIQEVSRNGESLFGGNEFESHGPDRYFQTKFGPINISYYHSPPLYEGWGYSGSWFGIGNCTGLYDFLIISYGPANSTLEISINVSTNTTFYATHGTDVFAFQRADFIGTINIGWKHGTFILNGEKQITIKNSLVCFFNTQWFGGFGYERLRYQTPSGNLAYHFAINFQYRTFLDRESRTFGSALWYGEKGIWTFTANYFLVASFDCPNLILAGADVQLPSNYVR
jgi:hypothetical protein